MGNCWAQGCCGLFLRREAGRLQRGGGTIIRKSKYFRTCSTGEHFTIEFENLVESDEGESPGSSHRPLTEEEIADLKDRHYDSIAEKQRAVDVKLQSELALQEEKLRIEEEALYAAQCEAARAAKQEKLLEVRGKRPQYISELLFCSRVYRLS
ncbi:AP-1 complex-associated regulatory protein-like [Struthio camelus]|uniref:AP-1 complex-associated regulatory protein-like n=1 Tax=Struthio camelus TaxID=8801 RepID=UPI003603BC85